MTEVVDKDMRMSAQDEIDLKELLGIFWRRRLFVSVMAVLFAAAAVGASYVVSKEYTATILLAPVSGGSNGFGSSGSLLSGYKGLAALAGFTSPEDEAKAESIALLKSTVIAEDFIQQNNLLPVLYESRWDAARRQWRTGVRIPTLWEGAQYFDKKITTVAVDTKSGLVTLSINWRNSEQAAGWANGLVSLTNEYSRQKAITVAARDIAFLNEQAAQTPYVEEHEAIASILQSELTKEMLAKGTDEYALRVIDPAFAPEKPSFPQRILWALLGLLAGGFVGCCYALLKHSDKERTGRAPARWRSEPAPLGVKSESGRAVTGSADG
jgi:capsular polysaccharide biosynthesis protein